MNGTRLKSAGNQTWMLSFILVAVYCFISENRYSYFLLYLIYLMQALSILLGMLRLIAFNCLATKGRKKAMYWANEFVYSVLYITLCRMIIDFSAAKWISASYIIVIVCGGFLLSQKLWKFLRKKQVHTDLLDD